MQVKIQVSEDGEFYLFRDDGYSVSISVGYIDEETKEERTWCDSGISFEKKHLDQFINILNQMKD